MSADPESTPRATNHRAKARRSNSNRVANNNKQATTLEQTKPVKFRSLTKPTQQSALPTEKIKFPLRTRVPIRGTRGNGAIHWSVITDSPAGHCEKRLHIVRGTMDCDALDDDEDATDHKNLAKARPLALQPSDSGTLADTLIGSHTLSLDSRQSLETTKKGALHEVDDSDNDSSSLSNGNNDAQENIYLVERTKQQQLQAQHSPQIVEDESIDPLDNFLPRDNHTSEQDDDEDMEDSFAVEALVYAPSGPSGHRAANYQEQPRGKLRRPSGINPNELPTQPQSTTATSMSSSLRRPSGAIPPQTASLLRRPSGAVPPTEPLSRKRVDKGVAAPVEKINRQQQPAMNQPPTKSRGSRSDAARPPENKKGSVKITKKEPSSPKKDPQLSSKRSSARSSLSKQSVNKKPADKLSQMNASMPALGSHSNSVADKKDKKLCLSDHHEMATGGHYLHATSPSHSSNNNSSDLQYKTTGAAGLVNPNNSESSLETESDSSALSSLKMSENPYHASAANLNFKMTTPFMQLNLSGEKNETQVIARNEDLILLESSSSSSEEESIEEFDAAAAQHTAIKEQQLPSADASNVPPRPPVRARTNEDLQPVRGWGLGRTKSMEKDNGRRGLFRNIKAGSKKDLK
jgi:hypothetical protein